MFFCLIEWWKPHLYVFFEKYVILLKDLWWTSSFQNKLSNVKTALDRSSVNKGIQKCNNIQTLREPGIVILRWDTGCISVILKTAPSIWKHFNYEVLPFSCLEILSFLATPAGVNKMLNNDNAKTAQVLLIKLT